MAACSTRPFSMETVPPLAMYHIGLKSRGFAPVRSSPPCAASLCSRWRSHDAVDRELAPTMRPAHAFVVPDGAGGTHGTVLYEPRFSASAEDHSWVEVMRQRQPDMPGFTGSEGANGNGCWFFPARGSGLWINVGRSWRGRSEHDFVRSSEPASFTAHWLASNLSRSNLSVVHGLSPTKEAYPLQARRMAPQTRSGSFHTGHLGRRRTPLDSTRSRWGRCRGVAISRGRTHRSSRPEIAACGSQRRSAPACRSRCPPPPIVLGAIDRAPPSRSASALQVRRGWKAGALCECNEASVMLECG